jgi:DNA invertase Pin-like site-specific DNA recombinase
MKKAAIYARVSTPDQHVETQLYDLRKLARRETSKSAANIATVEFRAAKHAVPVSTP